MDWIFLIRTVLRHRGTTDLAPGRGGPHLPTTVLSRDATLFMDVVHRGLFGMAIAQSSPPARLPGDRTTESRHRFATLHRYRVVRAGMICFAKD